MDAGTAIIIDTANAGIIQLIPPSPAFLLAM